MTPIWKAYKCSDSRNNKTLFTGDDHNIQISIKAWAIFGLKKIVVKHCSRLSPVTSLAIFASSFKKMQQIQGNVLESATVPENLRCSMYRKKMSQNYSHIPIKKDLNDAFYHIKKINIFWSIFNIIRWSGGTVHLSIIPFFSEVRRQEK